MREESKLPIISTNSKPISLSSGISIFAIFLIKKYVMDTDWQEILILMTPALSIIFANIIINYFSSYAVYSKEQKKSIKKIDLKIKYLKQLIKKSNNNEDREEWHTELKKAQHEKLNTQSK